MNKILRFSNLRINDTVGKLAIGAAIVAGAATHVEAQGEVASGTVSSSGSGPYTYDLTFADGSGASQPIGSVWYAWIPGQFYLPGTPTGASAPKGWTATVFNNSVQFVAGSSADDILPGASLSGFSYQASFTPAQLASAANSGKSVAYNGPLFNDGGNTFTVTVAPEPSSIALLVTGAAGLFMARRRIRA